MTISTDRAACERVARDCEGRVCYASTNAEWPNVALQDAAALIIALLERAERAEADNAALREDAERYRWVLHQAAITDFIFKFLQSKERHVSNAIDAARTE